MFYETAHTIGPGWQRSYKPSHYEDMSWSPSGGKGSFRSPGSSPESYRRRVDDFPRREEEFFGRRTSPTFPRRIFKEVFTETPNHRTFGERPRMFKRVFRPSEWSEEFDDEPHLRRVEREMDRDPDFERRFRDSKDDPEFERRFHHPKDDPEFERRFHNPKEDTDGGRVHHIPIVVEHRREESSPKTPSKEEGEEFEGPPQVHRLRRAFEGGNEDPFARRGMFSRREPAWDPAAARTLPTRKGHKASQSFDDSRHPVNNKHVHRSHSETHAEPPPAPHAPQPHSAAFRSHSDGHCPHQTFAPKKEPPSAEEPPTEKSGRPSADASGSSLGLQQIAAVLQTAEDLRKTVEAYSGSGRDKQYRFLDEMLTRCMLRLDDVDPAGKEDVRAARKGAVREVQSCIDRLEAKADEGGRRPPKESSPVEQTSQLPKVIPLEGPSQPPKVIPLDGPSQPPKVIPLDGPSQPPKVIPLEAPSQPPKVIPLGDVPGREPTTSTTKDADEKREEESQTKL